MEDQQGRSSADGDCRTPEKKWQQHPRGHAAPYQRRLLLPLLLALGLFMVSSVCSKFLASRGAGGRPDDNDLRYSHFISISKTRGVYPPTLYGRGAHLDLLVHPRKACQPQASQPLVKCNRWRKNFDAYVEDAPAGSICFWCNP